MGLLDSPARKAAEAAAKAAADGRQVFVYRLALIQLRDAEVSTELPQYGEQVEAIEAAGWLLDQWSFTEGKSGRPLGFLLFRRVVRPAGRDG